MLAPTNFWAALLAVCLLPIATSELQDFQNVNVAPVAPDSQGLLQDIHQVPFGSGGRTDQESDLANNLGFETRPFYAIAHRVLEVQGVRDALEDGANALEIDMTAWNKKNKGWWADHDGSPTSAGDTAWEMFQEIRKQRENGKTITFVWLDLKNPDQCDYNNPQERNCSIEALQQLARQYLEPVGIGALYGFYQIDPSSRAYKYIRGSLRDFEAINLDGDWKAASGEFERSPSIDRKQRVFSKGYFAPGLNLGGYNCDHESGICPELKKAAASERFGKVFGWTISNTEIPLVPVFLRHTEINGLIYGFTATHYYQHKQTKLVQSVIKELVDAHPFRHYAGQGDRPW